jgi:hypothetical protein
LGQLLEWFAAGAHRYGSSDVFDVLDEKKRLDEELAKAAAAEKQKSESPNRRNPV